MQRSTPYPEWIFGDVVRLIPRRAGKAVVGEDGKRPYRIAPCVHGCSAQVIVNATSFSENRRKSIEDHLSTCPRVPDGDRPPKKPRAFSINQVTDPEKCMAIAPLVHAKCNSRISDLEATQDRTNERLDVLEAKSTLYDSALQAVMPLVELPLVHGRAVEQLRVALPSADMTTVSAVSTALDFSSVEASRKLVNDIYSELCAAKLSICKYQKQLEERERQRSLMEDNWQEALLNTERLQRRLSETLTSASYRSELRGETPPTKRPHLGV